MRTATAASLTSLLGSLGLHGAVMLVLFLAVRQPAPVENLRERPDAWQGNAVEVDAIATPDGTPNIANVADAPAESPANAAPTPANPGLALASAAPAAVDPAPAPADTAPAPAHGPRTPTHTTPVAAQPHLRPQLSPSPVSTEPTQPATAGSPAKPKPKPRAQASLSSGSSGAESAAASDASAGNHDATTAAATGAFGSEGLPIGVRSLPSAFTRAIPPATGADPIWQSLPVGTQRAFTVRISIDEAGHIGGAELLESHAGQDAAPQFVHLRDRVIALLGGGLFALQNKGVAGTDLFRITITLSDRAVREESAPAELVERGFEPPRGTAPGRAYFTLASGRHFEAKVEVIGVPARAAHP